jgi:hypothetical protein
MRFIFSFCNIRGLVLTAFPRNGPSVVVTKGGESYKFLIERLCLAWMFSCIVPLTKRARESI